MESTKKEKGKKIGNIILNAITIVICLFVLFIVVNFFVNLKKEYNSYFGSVYLTVASDSMDHPDADKGAFKKGDVIRSKELSDTAKDKLAKQHMAMFDTKKAEIMAKNQQELGAPVEPSADDVWAELWAEGNNKIITFWDMVPAESDKGDWTDLEKGLNTHRIYRVEINRNTGAYIFYTRGDNPADYIKYGATYDTNPRNLEDVVAVFENKAGGFGSAILWLQTKNGMLVSTVVPALLIAIYALIMLISSLLTRNKLKYAETNKVNEQALREELLAELRREAGLGADKPADSPDKEADE